MSTRCNHFCNQSFSLSTPLTVQLMPSAAARELLSAAVNFVDNSRVCLAPFSYPLLRTGLQCQSSALSTKSSLQCN